MSQNHNTRSSAEVIPEVLEFRNKLGREWWYIVNMHVNGKYLPCNSIRFSEHFRDPYRSLFGCAGVVVTPMSQWRRCYNSWGRIHDPSFQWWCCWQVQCSQDQMVRPTLDHLAETIFHPTSSSNQLPSFFFCFLYFTTTIAAKYSLHWRWVKNGG